MRAYRFLLLVFLPLLSFGQATPVVVADICPGGCSSNPTNLVQWNGKVYFFATSPTAGRELHVYDGTTASVVADINPGMDNGIHSFSSLALLNGKLYFAANDTAGATRHYVYAYDFVNSPQRILLSNGQKLPSRGTLAASGNELLMEYNDSANRYRLAKYIPTTGTVQIVSTDLYMGSYISFHSLQSNGAFATYWGQLYMNSAKAFVCDLSTGTVIGTPSSHVGRATFGPGGVYTPYSDIGIGGAGGTHMSRFNFSPFGWSMLTSGSTTVLRYADLGAPAVFNGSVYYPALTTPGTIGNTPPVSLHRYDPSVGSATTVMSLPLPKAVTHIFGTSAVLNGILYVNYSSVAEGPELFAYTGGTHFVRLTDIDGPNVGFDPTAILSYNGNLLIAGTASASGTELYRITGTGLGLIDVQTSAAFLSPNPASTQLTITLPATSRYSLRILASTGQTVRTQTIEGNNASVNIEALVPGLYLAQFTNATTGAPAGTARFVKE